MAADHPNVGPSGSRPPGLPSHNASPMDDKAATAETMVESDENDAMQWSSYAASSSDTPCVAVIIGCNAPTRKSILITPTRDSPSAPSLDPHLSTRTSSSSTTSSTFLPIPAEGPENATPDTTRESSLESFKEDPARAAQLPAQHSAAEHEAQRHNVKFAPLPEMGPRKRRGMPLGVAARSRMVRRRRSRPGEAGAASHVVATPMWTEEELEEQRQRLAKVWEKEREKRDYHTEVKSCGGPSEDPITALGKLFKVARKQLWFKPASQEGKENVKLMKDQKGVSKGNEKNWDASKEKALPDDMDQVNFPKKVQAPRDGKEKEGDEDRSEEVGAKEIVREQPDNGTITRKRSLWSRTRSLSRKKTLPPVPETGSSTREDIPAGLRRRGSDAGKTVSSDTSDKGNSKVRLQRSLSA